MITEYFTPTHVYFGPGAEALCGKILKERGAEKVLLHYGSGSVIRSGLLAKVEKDLDANGIAYVTLGGVQPNPRLSLARKGIELCRKENVDFILAVGGGSVLDSAKCIGYGLYNEGDVWDYYDKKKNVKGCFPIGCILTLSATGSEMSNSSVITNEDGMLKKGLGSDYGRPAFALMNPELTYTVSAYQTGSGTADIMMHTMERFFIRSKTLHLTDEIAADVIRAAYEYGVKAIKNPCDYEARANLMWAGSLSHNGLTQACNEGPGDWACHQLEHELSGMFDVAHGAGLTAIWGAWARYVYKEDPSRFALYGKLVFGIQEADAEKAALLAIEATEKAFLNLGMPTTLTALGIGNLTEAQIEELAEKATFFGRRTIGAFKVLGKEDMKAIYRAAK